MNVFKNFRVSTQLTPVQQKLKDSLSIEFCEDEKGVDWYVCREQFSADTLKFSFNNDGVIFCATTDACAMGNPVGLSVAEIAPADVPDDFGFPYNAWVYSDGKIQPRIYTDEELKRQAENKKTQLLAVASAVISPLQDAVDLGEATDDETAQLKAWKKYRVLVNRVDTSNPVWPEQPTP
ncbi:tail fiber assembly protein [Salmonella enterica]|nr:tail fiber assembly protein [Salmonella enterica]EJF9115613.1 tail fiber assembly protein [Salmonella enterica]EJH7885601.1 tail fiber assembly protein [Salmonella enterica]EJK3921614.1 tail fiber assembly protein [Salmonella enterica]EJX2309421.1 tail fiber assembly protein [Salmonella enterica]